MKKSSFTKEIIDSITGEIASEFTTLVKRKVSTSQLLRRIRNSIGIDDLNDLTKDILSIAISDSLNEVKQSHSVIKRVLKDETNKGIIIEWIKNPKSYDENKSRLNLSYAVDQKDQLNLSIFFGSLHKKIELLRSDKFTPEHFLVIGEIAKIGSNVEKVVGVTDETNENVKIILEEIKRLSANSNQQTSNLEIDDKIIGGNKAVVTEIEGLINAGKIHDARAKADTELKQLKIGQNIELECRLYRFLADTYLKDEKNQKGAIKYLEKVVITCTDQVVIERNTTLLNLLKGNLKIAEQYARNLIEIDNSVRSFGLLANVLWALEKNDEAIDILLKNPFEDDPQYFYNLSHAYLEAKDYENAFASIKKSLKVKPEEKSYQELFIKIVTLNFQSKIPDKDTIWSTNKELQLINEAIKLSDALIDEIDPQENDRLAHAFSTRGILKFWSGDNDGSLNDLLKASKLVPNEPSILRNLANISASTGSFEMALQHIDELIDTEYEDISLIRLKSLLHLESGDPEKAVEFLESKLNLTKIEVGNIELYKILISAYDESFNGNKADLLIEKMVKGHGENTHVLFAKIEREEKLGNLDEAIKIAETIKKVRGRERLLLSFKKASLYYHLDTFDGYKKASELYSKICNPETDSPETYQYAFSLFKTNQYAECLDICKSVQKKGAISAYTEIEAEIYFVFENFQAASSNYKMLAYKYSNKVKYSIRYAVCLYRLNQKEKAHQVLRFYSKKVKDSAEDFLNIAYTYADIGDIRTAAEYADKAIEIGADNILINKGFLQIWLTDFSIGTNELPDKYVKKFQKTLKEFFTKFPEDDFIKEFQVNINDPDDIKRTFLENLPSEEHKQQMEEFFGARQYPVPLLSSFTGKDVFTTWLHLINNYKFGIFNNSGDLNQLSIERDNLRDARTIIIDPISLFTLNRFKLLEHLLIEFEEVLIPQRLLDVLQSIRRNNALMMKKGGMTIYSEGGELLREDVPSEYYEKIVEELDGIVDFITDNDMVKPIGKSIGRVEEFENKILKEVLNESDEITKELLLEGKHRKIPVLIEDWFYRSTAKDDFSIPAAGCRALIEVLKEKSIITNDFYHEILIGMVLYGYHFTIIESATFGILVQKNNYLINDEVLQFFDLFKKQNHDISSLLGFLLHCIKWVWENVTDNKIRQSWTLLLLNVIPKNYSRNSVKVFFERNIDLMFHQLESVKRIAFFELLGDWIKSSSIIY